MKWFALVKEINSKKLFLIELEEDLKTFKEAKLKVSQILKEEKNENFELVGIFSECVYYRKESNQD
ncbi:hypothetical protein [Caldisericum sp.]|uniref:hypothetical protein n=1 Tax=Caldisericum sp. TaxID=2499687 RepID=UPI003D10C311